MHSEAAVQREGFEECRKYYHLFEEFQKERVAVVPDVHRLRAPERELTSEISDAEYREVRHRQILESEVSRLKSANQNSTTDLEALRFINDSILKGTWNS